MIMKKTFLIIAMALLGMTQALAQDYEYVPFVREGVKWVYCIYNEESFYSPDPRFPIGSTYLNLEFKGDTIINGKSYKAMHKYYGQSINWENDTIPIYMREENEVVYGIVPDGKCYEDCPIGLWTYQDCYDRKLSGEEFVLYDLLGNKLDYTLDEDYSLIDMIESTPLALVKYENKHSKIEEETQKEN